jgi:hypothetical protein
MTEEPADPNRPDNLFAPVPGDHGATGPFTSRAKGFSLQLWLSLHRRVVAAMAGIGVIGLAFLAALRGPAGLAAPKEEQ